MGAPDGVESSERSGIAAAGGFAYLYCAIALLEETEDVKAMLVLTAFFVSLGATAYGTEAITGDWKTEGGEIAAISRCGDGYCITAKSGKFAGDKLGSFTETNGSYSGRISDPQTKAIYSGKLTVSGDSLKLRGCATTVLCKTQSWARVN